MKCPVCNDVRMREVQKNDVLIDVCPDCKGVWLDRGELEKLMSGIREMRDEYDKYEDYRGNRNETAYREDTYRREEKYRDDDKYPSSDKYKAEDRYREQKYYKRKKKNIFDIFDDIF